jgi:spore coat polysaccharide biosynthesis protein SpsF
MGSARLPKKVLEDIEGKPMLWHVVERVKQAKKIDNVIIATTTNSKDDAIEALAKKEGWNIYRGSKEDVLDRFYQAAKKFGVDIIVRITGDCPLISPEIIDICLERFLIEKCDYIANCFEDKVTFPRGLDVSVFSFSALEKAHKNAVDNYEKEHVVPYFWNNKNNEIKVGPVITAPAEYASDYRLTVDYPEDLTVIRKIYQIFYKPGEIINVFEAVEFLNKNPKIAKINAARKQKPFK